MPREIDCPDCENVGILLDGDICTYCQGTGKITVYTEEELQEKLGYVEGLCTPEELEKAIKQEKEECVLVCLDVATMFTENTDNHTVALSCADAIRARSKE